MVKKSDEVELCFQDLESKQSFLDAFKDKSPQQLNESTQELGVFASAFWPVVSLCSALLAVAMFINKLPMTTYIIGGIWAGMSLYMLYKRISAPPVVTRWSNQPAGVSSTVDFLKQSYALAIVMGLLVAGYSKLPDDSGIQIVYDYAAKDMLSATNVGRLIEQGGDPDYIGEDGQTALFLLIDQADTRANEIGMKIAVGALAKVTLGVSTTSRNSAKKTLRNHPELAAIALIKSGADVNVANADNVTPLQFALENYAEDALSLNLFRALLEAGANPDFTVMDGEMTATEYAKSNSAKSLFHDQDLAALLELYQEKQ